MLTRPRLSGPVGRTRVSDGVEQSVLWAGMYPAEGAEQSLDTWVWWPSEGADQAYLPWPYPAEGADN